MVDIGRHWWTMTDIVGHCQTLSDFVGLCQTLSDFVSQWQEADRQGQVTRKSIYSPGSS